MKNSITQRIVDQVSRKQTTTVPRKPGKGTLRAARELTVRDLGWTREYAREVRAKLATFATDWDDPSMDIYNEPPTR